MSSSPWGKIQHSERVTRGVRVVSTAGHGGIMVTRNFAERHFSAAARARGLPHGDHLCYEEDCKYSIVLWEMRNMGLAHAMFQVIEEDVIKSLSRWNPDYLMEVGVVPDYDTHELWRKSHLINKMREERHPDLIVSAVSVSNEVVKVTTADGQEHLVTGDSYDCTRTLNLLSKCEVAG